MGRLSLGTSQFGLDYGINNRRGKIPREEVFAILDFAAQEGIDALDTAPAYGDSENVVGDYLKRSNNQFKIVSKLSKESFPNVEKSIDLTLKRLGIKSIYGIIFHHFEDFRQNPDYFKILEEYKMEGKIKKIGFSLYTPDALEDLFEKQVNFDLVQVPYNIFDQRFGRYFLTLKKRGIEIHIRSIFLQGLFFMPLENLDFYFDGIKEQIQLLHNMSNEYGLAMVNLCIGFIFFNEHIDKMVVGVDTLENLKEIVIASHNIDKVREIKEKLLQMAIDDEKYLLPFNWQVAKS
jgi:aryl-alcohol dehydrogenase-like predicted oxidoreductase